MKTFQAISWVFLTILSTLGSAADLEIDQARSRIHVDAKATGHSFTGTLTNFTASVEGDSTTIEPSSFKLGWSFKDLKTADDKRDKQMLVWLGGGDPKGKFELKKSWIDAKEKKHVMGTITINGVSKTISFPYSVKKDGNWVTIDGKANLDYEDFRLPIIRAMALMTVDPKLIVRFHIVGQIK